MEIAPRIFHVTKFTPGTAEVETVSRTVRGHKVPLRTLARLSLERLGKEELLAMKHYNPATMCEEEIKQRLTQLNIVGVCARLRSNQNNTKNNSFLVSAVFPNFFFCYN